MEDIEQAPAPAAPEPIAEPQAEPAAESTPDEGDTRSRLDSIRDAFDKVDDAEPEGGESAEKAPETQSAGQPRGPDGKFAAKTPPEPKAEEKPKPDQRSIDAAPSRFSADAKAAWKDAPEAVRGEINRAMAEMEAGLQRYQAEMEPLKPFQKMAQDKGTTIPDALNRYIGMENLLRRDPIKGLQELGRNLGMTPQKMAEALQGQQGQPDQRDRTIAQLQQQVQHLSGQVQGVSRSMQGQAEAAVTRDVNAFAATHEHFDALSHDIARIIREGQARGQEIGLESAYNQALANAQELAGKLVPQPAPSAQTRPARSVTGSPTAGSNPVPQQPSATRMGSISKGFAGAGLT